jgi:phosphotriesterase-related protein
MRISRRTFVASTTAAALGIARGGQGQDEVPIDTVRGPIRPRDLGITLMHEHVLVDFIGAEKIGPGRYDPDEAFRIALPHLKRLRGLGCRTLVECTPAFIGRDPLLLRRLAGASGLHLLTNTGYYAAAGTKYVPRHAYSESVEELARRWITEFEQGIGNTGIRPAFIKTGMDKGPLPEISRKLIRAAAITARATGLKIAAHSGDGDAALEALDILRDAGVKAGAFIWVHAQNEKEPGRHARAAEMGAWVEFDGISEASLDRHLGMVRAMIDRGLIGRVLLSQDAGWYRVGEPGGGNFLPYDLIFTRFLPALRQAGASEEQVRQLMVLNPREALRRLP